MTSRNDFFAQLAKGKRVLDVGCVDHLGPCVQSAPLHRLLAQHAESLVGVDYQQSGVAELRQEGYDVHHADITRPGLKGLVGSGFDLVTAGEILEHLIDLSSFFSNVREVLAPTGKLAISTPNPHSLYLTCWNLAGRNPDNVDHVVYHWPSGIAEIADRTGFELVEIRGERQRVRGVLNKTLTVAGRALRRVWPEANPDCVSVIYVLSPR